MPHRERHRGERIGWLRAAVLGANDGIVSTASLVVGVAASAAGKEDVLLAGVAGLVAGAFSMAAGEYVSVSSQADTERADLLALLLTPPSAIVLVVSLVSLVCLLALGAIAARLGGASMFIGAARVTVWGVLALAATAAVGRLFGRWSADDPPDGRNSRRAGRARGPSDGTRRVRWWPLRRYAE
jgi:VIT1/CCC1 family predicted Fe2+/Mn2+ transporter